MPVAESHSGSGSVFRSAAALLLCLLFAVALTALLQQTNLQTQRSWQDDRIPVTLADQHYLLPGSQLQWLQDFSTEFFNAEETRARELLDAELRRQLDIVFGGATARLPDFADWYYSLSGEYSRIAMSLLAKMNLSDRQYLTEQTAAILFPEGVWEIDMHRAQQETANTLLAHQREVRAAWLSALSEQLNRYRVPAPLESTASTETAVDLDQLLTSLRLQEHQAALDLRMSLSSVAAAGAAGQTLWRATSARSAAAAARGGSVLAGRTAGRTAGRAAARAGSAAVTGGTVCAAGGPLALGCAAAAGAVTWVASDWLLLQIDEIRNRDEMIEALRLGLDDLQTATHQELMAAYDALMSVWYDSAETEISRSFVPLDSLQPR